jgi:hypothetical protein
LRHRIHLRSLNVSVGTWQLLLWLMVVPVTWALLHFVYRRRPSHRGLSYALFATGVVAQAAALVSFAISRNADLLFSLLWLSLVALLAGAALLPNLRLPVPGRAGPAES